MFVLRSKEVRLECSHASIRPYGPGIHLAQGQLSPIGRRGFNTQSPCNRGRQVEDFHGTAIQNPHGGEEHFNTLMDV